MDLASGLARSALSTPQRRAAAAAAGVALAAAAAVAVIGPTALVARLLGIAPLRRVIWRYW